MPRPGDAINRIGQSGRRTVASKTAMGRGFQGGASGRDGTMRGAWDASRWDYCRFAAGGRLIWDESQWDAGDTFEDEATGRTGYFDADYWGRCQWTD